MPPGRAGPRRSAERRSPAAAARAPPATGRWPARRPPASASLAKARLAAARPSPVSWPRRMVAARARRAQPSSHRAPLDPRRAKMLGRSHGSRGPVSILIVGGAGYIGSHTAKLIAQAGEEPVVFDNLVYGHRAAVKWGPFVEGDLADTALIDRVLRAHDITAGIHFAAYTYVGESVANPRKYFRNNVVNALNLLDAMVDRGERAIVFSSTAATYGDPIEDPISEAHPQLPINPYGETKLAVEKTLKWYAGAYGLRYAALRYFNAAGADPDGEIGEDHTPESHLIPLAIEAAMGRRPMLDLYGTDYPPPDGTAVR